MALLAATGTGSGCKDNKIAEPPKAPGVAVQYKGKVTYKGQALPAGYIRVMAEDSREEASARIQKDGTYSVAGPVGRVRVTVDTTLIRDEYDGNPAEQRKWYVPIPGRYAVYSETPIRITVDSDQTLDLELTDQ